MRRLLLASAATLVGAATLYAPAQAAPASVAARAAVAAGEQPLVYVIVLDGLDGDLYDAGRLPFLKGLVDTRGTYYQESRSIMVAETNPNHTAMISGAYADTSGIPANDFALYGKGATSVDGCPVAKNAKAPSKTGLAAGCVKAQTFFQSTAGNQRITTAGVFGKPKLATLFSAKRSAKKYAADYLWTPCTGAHPSYCRKVPLSPYGYANDDDTMSALMATVRKGVKSENGKRRTPNLTFVNMPTIDVTGHTYGAGKRYKKAATSADDQLRRFVKQQKKLGLWKRTVMFVVSDHSMATTERKVSLAQRFTQAGIPTSAYVIVANGGTDLVYLSDPTSPDRFALLAQMREAALGLEGVDEALYREANPRDAGASLDEVHPDWHLAGDRTGDLVVTQAAGGAFMDPSYFTVGGHGGPNTLDNIFTITGGWSGLAKNGTLAGQQAPRFDDTALNPGQAENVDVAPTALALLGQQPPRDNKGRVLTEAFTGL